MQNFWGSEVWGLVDLIAVLLLSLIAANIIKRRVKWMRESLVPTSVLGGILLLVVAGIYDLITGDVMFETGFFGGNGYEVM